ncbi:hypothetical protein EFL45_06395 [Weissella confusa]|uniref:hypothetical protein n=1 Tax=Weissella confusa TaxID=1583 RepID=UPI00223B5AA8|nr:hypothetical protein [Weissella confusa]MCT0009827.1 hypothetical protein [Weissella confusa]MCT0026101.1 hypothetical protein [Weissella confusa]MCT0949051.1 hypothetical protein [Weissella confusa]
MKKIVNIGGTEVNMVTSGATPIFYRNEFNGDFFSKFKAIIELATKSSEAKTDTERFETTFNSEEILLIQQFAWVYAKNANANIAPLEQWLAEFEEFPVFDVLSELVELMMTSITTKKV